ncbi:peptidoglycan-binding protein [Yinghuangia seranimata]|uniref:peptidoglycan-binding protein n=1 Tax=Yinghuangia seranimata TaxID=408067 RepID=UPI00248C4D10|nr:peptidoglycan-binding protein [Yinghuangia seranimata]MDI2129205.1 peptidoglycan-binding protein [Yinghuangia seranimata]
MADLRSRPGRTGLGGPPAGASESEPVQPLRRRRGRALAWVVVIAVVLAGAGVAAARFIKSPAERAAEADPPAPSVITAPVESRRLTDTVVLRGQVAAAQTVEVAPQGGGGKDAAGKPVVTGVRVTAGDVLKPGQVLLEISGRPVFVLPGEVPVYRDLKPGAEGKDVAQLQAALAALGLKSGADKDGSYGTGTRKAVEDLYRRLGYEPPRSPDAGDEQLKGAQDRVTQAERAAKTAKDALASARAAAKQASPPPSGPASGGPGADPVKAAEQQSAYADEDLAKARKDLADLQAKAGAMVPAAEVVFLKGFPGRVDAVGARVGGEVKEKAVTISAGALVAKGQLAPHEKGLVRPGMKVRLLSELTGVEAEGTVASVADTPTVPNDTDGRGAGAGASTGRTFEMVVAPTSPLDPKLAGQDVRLTVEAASSDGEVLVVPLSAVSAGADGRTVVTVLAADGGQHRVEVRPGPTGDGFVQVTPAGGGRLTPGDRVVVGVKRTRTDSDGGGRGGAPAGGPGTSSGGAG